MLDYTYVFRIYFENSPPEAFDGATFESFRDRDVFFPELSDADVPGRIGRPEFFSFWRDVLKAPADILEIIQDGYSVPFVGGILPPPAFAPNNQSALRNADFLLEELLRLEKIHCLERINYQPRIVLPCSVVFSNKWRLVTDASRHLNPAISRAIRNMSLIDGSSSTTSTVYSLIGNVYPHSGKRGH